MPPHNKRKQQILKAACRQYEEGQRLNAIADSHCIKRSTLYTWLKSAGVQFRPPGHDQRKTIDIETISTRYKNGESLLALSKEFKVSRLLISKRLLEAGVPQRTLSECLKLGSAKMTAEARKHRAFAAHAAVRGTKYSQSYKEDCAIVRQLQAKMTPKEQEYFEKLISAGLNVIPQYAVEAFNVDFAVADAKIAIEVRSQWSSFAKKGAKERRKDARLTELGWLIFSLCARSWREQWLTQIWEAVRLRRMQSHSS